MTNYRESLNKILELSKEVGLPDLLNKTLTSTTCLATGVNIARNVGSIYLSNTLTGKIFYGASTIFSGFSLGFSLRKLNLGHSPFHTPTLSTLVGSFTFQIAGNIANRISECQDMTSYKLASICLEEIIREASPLKKFRNPGEF